MSSVAARRRSTLLGSRLVLLPVCLLAHLLIQAPDCAADASKRPLASQRPANNVTNNVEPKAAPSTRDDAEPSEVVSSVELIVRENLALNQSGSSTIVPRQAWFEGDELYMDFDYESDEDDEEDENDAEEEDEYEEGANRASGDEKESAGSSRAAAPRPPPNGRRRRIPPHAKGAGPRARPGGPARGRRPNKVGRFKPSRRQLGDFYYYYYYYPDINNVPTGTAPINNGPSLHTPLPPPSASQPSAPAHLDSGSQNIPGGGYPGCGRAPLNRLTPGISSAGYIINGEKARYGEFPQYIHLETLMPHHMIGLCGGTLVSDQHVITAAHCVKDHDNLIPASRLTVIFGESDMLARDPMEFRMPVSHICVSRLYRHASIRHDWAILTLARRVNFNNYIQPACLPRLNQRVYTSGRNSRCYLVGAGVIGMKPDPRRPNDPIATSSTVVNKMHMENVPCMIWGFGAIDQDRVCYTRANNLPGDSCVGDSGGPILCLDQQNRWTLVASVSYGSVFCEHSRVSVYARTRTLLNDMQQQCGLNLLR